jgi:hypothetical protein
MHSRSPFSLAPSDGSTIVDADGDIVAVVPAGPRSAANTALIIAAPELLRLADEAIAAEGDPTNARAWDAFLPELRDAVARAHGSAS